MKLNPVISTLLLFSTASLVAAEKPNVLFIAVDDLRPELACYGQDHIHSPNIDRLAESGFVFERAYCMVPTCGASRASLMTGIRPTRNRFRTYLANAEKEAPGITTLNTHFKNHGYHTVSNGKVLHHGSDNDHGWSEAVWKPRGKSYLLSESLKAAAANPKGKGPPTEAAESPDQEYRDGMLATKVIRDLRRLKEKDQPFFLAAGFYKPHLPFVAPQKYWDLYDRQSVHLPGNYHPPQNAPEQAIHNSGELRSYVGIPKKGLLPEELARQLIHGYYACVSFTDAQIGRILDELDRLELTDSTIVVLWGDHGWNLAEHTLWCKHSCFETSMHAPLIVRAPGVHTSGQRTAALTEFVDIYPSLCELAGLPLPDHLQGQSFVPQLRDPSSPGNPTATGRFKDGDTIRTDTFRFTEYSSKTGTVTARMLYDHSEDPDENSNVAESPEHRENIQQLQESLKSEMQSARR